MTLKIIVTVKQVPDTQNITGDAMSPNGTVNRNALPAIFNPEDLNALEEALKIKETWGAKITAITMGPPKAAEVLKQCLYRGADEVILVTDRKFAGADTLATSYALKSTIDKIGDYDLVLCGRQAIDGDTAQVGPQLAEKLNINQMTNIIKIEDIELTENSTDKNVGKLTVKRCIDGGYEVISSKFPVLLTVTSEANEPRPPSAKRVMTYKNIDTINADPEKCGLSGSPTKVKGIQNVVLKANEIKNIPNTEQGVKDLIHELNTEHIIG